MNSLFDQISKIGIVPVVKFDDPDDAVPVAQALADGGLSCIEVTFRTNCAAEAIKRITSKFPDLLIGAGTVLTADQAEQAAESGSSFIVSPGLNVRTVEYCIEKGIPVIPGCSSPTDIETALSLNLSAVKIFPAEVLGGTAFIKALSGPYPQVTFMPTGGVGLQNMNSYLDNPKVLACGGSFMVNDDDIKNKNYEKITELTKNAVANMLGFEFSHLGVNCPDSDTADSLSTAFNSYFNFEKKPGNSSIFAGSSMELTRTPFPGAHGHIAIRTNSMKRAMYYLERQGLSFNLGTAKYDNKNNIKAIYLNGEFGGFAIHLLQK